MVKAFRKKEEQNLTEMFGEDCVCKMDFQVKLFFWVNLDKMIALFILQHSWNEK